MQVQKIQNNSTSFGAVYRMSLIKFTPKQNEVIDEIVKTLREPMPELDNQTPEDYYKSKNGIDFSIDNNNQNDDSVFLKGVLGAKDLKNKRRKAISYQNSFDIGVYSPEHKFDINDIESGLSGYKQKERNIIKMALIPIIGIAALIGIYICKKPANPKTEPLIETMDSISSKAKTVLQDAVKINTNSFKP